MTTLAAGLALLLHATLVLGLAPLLAGAMDQLPARLLGRSGGGILAPYHELQRALRKQPVISEATTVFARAAPTIAVSATICAAMLVPSFSLGMATAKLADLLTILGLLAVARGALVLGALDIGTSLGGLGAARATTRAALAVPAIVAIGWTLALLTGSTNLDAALAVLRDGPLGARWPAAIALGGVIAALGLVAVVLTGRRPADQPSDPLALAMGHEALLLEYSGADLALLRYAGALQMLVWLTLIGAIALPVTLAPAGAMPVDASAPGGGLLTGWVVGLLGWVGKTAVLAAALAIYETASARMATRRVPGMLGVAAVLASLSVLLLFAAQASP